MSSLSEFMNDNVNCRELRLKVAEFLLVTKANRIDTFQCPVCNEDLRKTYQQGIQVGRGNCVCCKLGIQMQHTITHEGHTEPSGAPCSVVVTYPVSMADPELMKRLRKAWTHMQGERLVSQTGGFDLETWVLEAQDIARKYNTERKPV